MLNRVNPPNRTGLCYQLAYQFIFREKEGVLVHGQIYAGSPKHWMDHAWVETGTGFVYEPVGNEFFPKKAFYTAFRAKPQARFTPEKAMIALMRNNHYGPWVKANPTDLSRVPVPVRIIRKEEKREIPKPLDSLPPEWWKKFQDPRQRYPNPMLFDDTYTGPRYRYGLTYRPPAYANIPAGWIVFSNRPDPRFRHGIIEYPRKLTDHEVEAYELTPIVINPKLV